MPSVWFVDSTRAAVTWGTAVTGAPGRRTAQTDIYRVVRDGAPGHEAVYLWARTGAPVNDWKLLRAQAEQSSDAVPDAYPPPVGGASSSGGSGLTPAQLDALATDAELAAAIAAVNAGKADASTVTTLAAAVAGKYVKPAGGIPASDLDIAGMAASLPVSGTGGTGGLVPVAASAGTFGAGTANWSTDTLRSWKNKHTMLTAAPFVVLEFVNWYPNGGADADGPAAMTLRVGVEKSGSILPVKFSGADTVTIPPGGSVFSDPVYIDGVAGDLFYSRVTATMAAGNTYVFTGTADAGYAFSPTQDNSRSGTNYAGGANQSVVPTRILGRPPVSPRKVFALLGDSIMQGALASVQYEGGYSAALISARVPFVKIARGGEAAFNITSLDGFSRRLAAIAGCTDAIVEYGTNDLANGTRTAAQLQADLVTIYGRLTRMGVKRIWQTTITPRTTSTDSFATTANQTPIIGFTPGGARSQVNAWIRANTAGITGFIEIADLVESGRDTGLWNPTYAADGVHPNQAAHVALQARITALL